MPVASPFHVRQKQKQRANHALRLPAPLEPNRMNSGIAGNGARAGPKD